MSDQSSSLSSRAPGSDLSLVGRVGTAWLLGLTAVAVLLVSVLETQAGVIRPIDRWLYPVLTTAAAVAGLAVVLGRLRHTVGLRLLTVIAALYTGLSVSLDWLSQRPPTMYDLASLSLWLLIVQVMLYATFAPRRALTISLPMLLSLVPIFFWTDLPAEAKAGLRLVAVNAIVVQGLVSAVLFIVARQFYRLARIGGAIETRDEPLTVRELAQQRAQEHAHLHSMAERADAAAREQERTLLSMMEVFPGYVARVDAHGRVTHANERMAQRHGLTAAEIVGRSAVSVLGEERWAIVQERQRRVLETGQPQIFEHVREEPDGLDHHMLGTQYAVPDETGQPGAGFFQVGLDITEWRHTQRALDRSLAQLDALFEALPLPTVVRDAQGRFQRVNRAYCELTGLRADDILGRTVDGVTPSDQRRGFEHTDRVAIESRQVQRLAITRADPQGQQRDMVLHKAAIFTPGGEYIGMVSTLFDVTEINAASRLLALAREAAEAANDAKSAFLATMSHEIRTPMNGVIGMAEVMLHADLPPVQADHARVIRDSARGLLSLLDSILDFSKIEAGGMDLSLGPVEVRALLSSTGAVFEPSAQAAGVTLHGDVTDAVPFAILADELRLRQILNNLVSNAIKFSGRQARTGRTGEVHVILDADGRLLTLTVSDNGIGIDASAQARIFEPFMQAEATTERRFGGTGLGLAITQKLVRQLGGEIQVHSEVGRGTRFVVQLPLQMPLPPLPGTASPADHAARAAAAEPPPPRASAASPTPDLAADAPQILVAEDDAVNRLVLQRQLELLGYRADMATDGEQALQLWRQRRHGLILTDLHMPTMDGYALARAIRAETGEGHWGRPAILALTANALKGEDLRARQAGLDEYLTKPIAMTDLDAALQRWADNARAEQRGGSLPLEKGPGHVRAPAAGSQQPGADLESIEAAVAPAQASRQEAF